MHIRRYLSSDCQALAELFYHTVHTVNARDYTPLQLNAWASGAVDLAAWDRSFREHLTLVAEEGAVITGFGDIDSTGYLDRLYIHRDFQRRGIASAICGGLESSVLAAAVTTHASITARPFFERRGYRTVTVRQVLRSGVSLTNYLMEKPLPPHGPHSAEKG